MPVQKRLSFLLALPLVLLNFAEALGQQTQNPLHYSADKQVWNRREKKVELFNNAVVKQPGEVLNADYIALDTEARTLNAKGNCVYIATDTVIYADEMNFNLDTRTGTILNGRVSNERFALAGERINKLGAKRFQTHWGEYSTCRDCPQSWSFLAEDVDMEIEGYAYMSNVTTKIKGAPGLWVPYLIVPMKTQRQSGVLFPKVGWSDTNGFQFVLPVFWAINRSADMTFGVGDYSKRGRRLEWQGRYVLSDRSKGTANVFYLRDQTREFDSLVPHRWAVDLAQSQELPFGIEQKFRLIEMSDNKYPTFVGDIPGRVEPSVASDLIFSYSSSEVSAYLAGRRYRNLLSTDPDPEKRLKDFDSRTVQSLPAAVVTTNDQFLFGTPVAAGLTVGVTNFTRTANAFDYDDSTVPFGSDPFEEGAGPVVTPGVDPIRKATRFSVTPSVYTTLRPLDTVSLVPSLKYHSYYYNFRGKMDNLSRGYLLFQTDLMTQMERIFDTANSEIPRVKHLIRPTLTYSYIPYVREDSRHPFLRQVKHRAGYNFDNYDIVPLDSSPSNVNYFVPLGNSIAYGFSSQLIRRRELGPDAAPVYQRTVEWNANHALNLRDHLKPYSRFNTSLLLDFDAFNASTEYSYTPYISKRHSLQTSASYVFERSFHQQILKFDRSVSLSYGYNPLVRTSNLTGKVIYSLNDYVMPSLSTSYSYFRNAFLSNSLAVEFQSPSRCWRFSVGLTRHIDTGLTRPIDFSINLTGSGFEGFEEYVAEPSKAQ